jgi:hypothetical protein
MGKEMVVPVIRAELAGVCGLGDARKRGKLDGVVALAGHGSTAAAVSGGGKNREKKRQQQCGAL